MSPFRRIWMGQSPTFTSHRYLVECLKSNGLLSDPISTSVMAARFRDRISGCIPGSSPSSLGDHFQDMSGLLNSILRMKHQIFESFLRDRLV
eukprot:jgi/Botrbrau1/20691/Bobra.0058s0021.1